ncbi:MAG: FKBP-type peptidyl-prolyl cis-trans isomerase [Bacteroidales bacterium]|nr:FKBP-type peptidyl-prolyl cis-trans isomerase [Bacteroidales bacterium]
MNKSILWLLGLLLAVSFATISCSETDGTVDQYADWEERNQHYIDSIATVAEANQGDEVGQWRIIRSYKLPPLAMTETGNVSDNVYCKILAKGEGTVSPLFTDTAGVHYRGKFIDGSVFSQSYQGELDLNFAVPSYSPSLDEYGNVSDFVVGPKTATMQMHVGDRWEIYIPYQLGYGESGNESIRGYSTLIFDWYLVDIIPLKSNERSISEASEDEEN